MSLLERLKRKAEKYKPVIKSAYVPYLDLPAAEHKQALSEQYEMRLVESSTDPLLPKVAPPWLRKLAEPRLDAGDWYAMAILDGEEVAGRVWMALRVPHGAFNGVMNVNLADDEAYGFDLYVEPAHRRGDLSNFMADHCIAELQRRGVRIGYTHLDTTTFRRCSGTRVWASTHCSRTTTSRLGIRCTGRSPSPTRPAGVRCLARVDTPSRRVSVRIPSAAASCPSEPDAHTPAPELASALGHPTAERWPLNRRSRRLLVTTNTDDAPMAAAAIMGRSTPKAASGMAAAL